MRKNLYGGQGYVELVDMMGDDSRVAWAARTSTGGGSKTPERDRRLIHYLFRHKHHSPLEHVVFTFEMKVPIFVARQLMRHRIGWSFNELSRRYVSPKPEFYHRHGADPKTGMFYEGVVEQYNFLLERYDNEVARDVLPMSTMTTIRATVNLRALLHFFDLRLSENAQNEIRELASGMFDLVFGDCSDGPLKFVCEAYSLYALGGLDNLIATVAGLESAYLVKRHVSTFTGDEELAEEAWADVHRW